MTSELPHHHVFVRLAASPIAGVGAFAIRPIPQGTDIFANDRVELVWIARAEIEAAGLTAAERRLYFDFGIARGEMIGCPVNFHNLTPGWYCNEPAVGESANLEVDANFTFRASRDIAEGEEVTVRYNLFSDAPGA